MVDSKRICLDYYYRAGKRVIGLRRDSFNKQYFAEGLREIWSSFDAYLNSKYPTQKFRRDKLDTFYSDFDSKFKGWGKSDMPFKESLGILIRHAPVEDRSSSNAKPPETLTNPNSLQQIINVSWRVRSNLDHGDVDLESDKPEANRDRELVEHSLKVTHEILDKVLKEEKWV